MPSPEDIRGESDAARFKRAVLPHIGAAYNLAGWLTRNNHDAEDLVQEAYLRALNSFDGFRGGDGRGWLLAIVRNTYYTWRQRHRATAPLDETPPVADTSTRNPEALLLAKADVAALRSALEQLPVEFREAIVLREMEGMSYREIAEIAGVPLGTVMSRLARGRQRLFEILSGQTSTAGAK